MSFLFVARFHIATAMRRLLGRNRVQAMPVDSLGAVLEATAETGKPIVIPGLLAWLDSGQPQTSPDYGQSVDDNFTETLEEFCTRITEEAQR